LGSGCPRAPAGSSHGTGWLSHDDQIISPQDRELQEGQRHRSGSAGRRCAGSHRRADATRHCVSRVSRYRDNGRGAPDRWSVPARAL